VSGSAARVLAGAAVAVLAASARAELFVVAEPRSPCAACDAYVLPLQAPADVAHARDLIVRGPALAGAPIAVARIAAGPDGVNRNVLAPGEPPWSWRVTEFQGFADFTIELCDGTPTLVEQDVAGWIANTGGVICFWGYTVVAELPTSAIPGLRAPGVVLLLAALCVAGVGRLRAAERKP
jgi:hypothetical protein